MNNSTFHQLMQDAIELHDAKSHDYASDSDKYSNFKRAAVLVSWFKDPVDQVFACMIGIKLARLAELRNGKEPKNESRRDTSLDLVNYAGLWGGWIDEKPGDMLQAYKTDIGFHILNNDKLPPSSNGWLQTNTNPIVYYCAEAGCTFTCSTSKDIINHIWQNHGNP